MQRKDGISVDLFITEESFQNIEDGQFLKITYSPRIFVKHIFENISNQGRSKCFEDLYKLSTDPGFIKELGNRLVLLETNTYIKLIN